MPDIRCGCSNRLDSSSEEWTDLETVSGRHSRLRKRKTWPSTSATGNSDGQIQRKSSVVPADSENRPTSGKRKLSEMHSQRDAHLPIPATVLRLSRWVYSFWKPTLIRIREIWDWTLIWIFAHWFAYRSTEDDRSQLLEWVRSKAPGSSVSDFSSTWRNGVALVALLEGLLPAACAKCTQYHLLNPKHSIQNVEMGFSVAHKYIGLKPNMKASEVVAAGTATTERKLICYITMIKLAMSLPKMQAIVAQSSESCPKDDPLFRNQPCLAKGMGLILAVKGRWARFNLYLKHCDFLDVVIEIRGAEGDFCSHRITLRSPHKTLNRAAPLSPQLYARASPETSLGDVSPLPSSPVMTIPLEYEITGRKISVMYMPCSAGKLKLSIFWHGQHLQGSPYVVTVDDSLEKVPEAAANTHPATFDDVDINLLRVQPVRRCPLPAGPRKVGRVICRRVIRRVVIRNGEEIELRDGEPLPPDARTWCSSKSVLLDDSSDVESTPPATDKKPASETLRRSRSLIKEDSIDLGLNPIFMVETNNNVMSSIKELEPETAASPIKSPILPMEKFIFIDQLSKLQSHNQSLVSDSCHQKQNNSKLMPNEEMVKEISDIALNNIHVEGVNVSGFDTLVEKENETIPNDNNKQNYEGYFKLEKLTNGRFVGESAKENDRQSNSSVPLEVSLPDMQPICSTEQTPENQQYKTDNAVVKDCNCSSANRLLPREDNPLQKCLDSSSCIVSNYEGASTSVNKCPSDFQQPEVVLTNKNITHQGKRASNEELEDLLKTYSAEVNDCSSCAFSKVTESEKSATPEDHCPEENFGATNGENYAIDEVYCTNKLSCSVKEVENGFLPIVCDLCFHNKETTHCGVCPDKLAYRLNDSIEKKTSGDSMIISKEANYNICTCELNDSTVHFQQRRECNREDKNNRSNLEEHVTQSLCDTEVTQTNELFHYDSLTASLPCDSKEAAQPLMVLPSPSTINSPLRQTSRPVLPSNFIQRSAVYNPEQSFDTPEGHERLLFPNSNVIPTLAKQFERCTEENNNKLSPPETCHTSSPMNCINCPVQKEGSSLTCPKICILLDDGNSSLKFNCTQCSVKPGLCTNLSDEDEIELSRRDHCTEDNVHELLNLHWDSLSDWSGSDSSIHSSHTPATPLNTTSHESVDMDIEVGHSTPIETLLPELLSDESISIDTISYSESTASTCISLQHTNAMAVQTSFTFDSSHFSNVSARLSRNSLHSPRSYLSLSLSPTFLEHSNEVCRGNNSNKENLNEHKLSSLASFKAGKKCDKVLNRSTEMIARDHQNKVLNIAAREINATDDCPIDELPIKSPVKAKIREWEMFLRNHQFRKRSSSCPESLQTGTVQHRLDQLHHSLSFNERRPIKNYELEQLKAVDQMKICASRAPNFKKTPQELMLAIRSPNLMAGNKSILSERLCEPNEAVTQNTGFFPSCGINSWLTGVQINHPTQTRTSNKCGNNSNSTNTEGNFHTNYICRKMLKNGVNNETDSKTSCSNPNQVCSSSVNIVGREEVASAGSFTHPTAKVLEQILDIQTMNCLQLSCCINTCICARYNKPATTLNRQLLVPDASFMLGCGSQDGQHDVVAKSKYHLMQYNPIYKCTET